MAKQIRKCDFCLCEYIPDKRNLKRGWGLCCSKSCSGNKRELDKMNFIPSDLISLGPGGDYLRIECMVNNIHNNYLIYATEIGPHEIFIANKNNTYSSKFNYSNLDHRGVYPIRLTGKVKAGVLSLIKNNINNNNDYVIKTIDKFLSLYGEYKIELIGDRL